MLSCGRGYSGLDHSLREVAADFTGVGRRLSDEAIRRRLCGCETWLREILQEVLGVDSANGTESLFLNLFDQGGVGIGVQSDKKSLFLGIAPAGSFMTNLSKPLHGFILRDGDQVKYKVNSSSLK